MFEVARFEPTAVAVHESRRWLATCLRGEVDGAMIDDAQLCVSELAANAVRHAATPFRVELRTGPSWVRVSVHDEDPRGPESRRSTPEDPGGRGLAIVDAVATRWGWTPDPGDGKDVWFELGTHPGSSADGQHGEPGPADVTEPPMPAR
jgi:anti-sigma regulatory factor (Ser/Thr protein kinase)